MTDNDTPRYGQRAGYDGPTDGTTPAPPPAKDSGTFGKVMTVLVVVVPLLTVCIPLGVWLTRLALGG
jgi:hypothetical protein